MSMQFNVNCRSTIRRETPDTDIEIFFFSSVGPPPCVTEFYFLSYVMIPALSFVYICVCCVMYEVIFQGYPTQ